MSEEKYQERNMMIKIYSMANRPMDMYTMVHCTVGECGDGVGDAFRARGDIVGTV